MYRTPFRFIEHAAQEKVGGFLLREAINDLPTRCTCCDPRRQLVVIPDEFGLTLKCPSGLASFRVQHGDRRILTGVYIGPVL